MPEPHPCRSHQRLAGAALGLLCGDALGMPVEGLSAAEIAALPHPVDTMKPGRLPAGSYTDDGQMMLGVLETLAATGGLDPGYLAQRWAATWDPARGYGGRIPGVMARIRQGVPWDQCGTDSWGNGAAMRVGPLGVFHAGDAEAVARTALDQARITHTHPQALAGAVAVALGVDLACRLASAGRRPQARDFLDWVAGGVRALDADFAQRLLDMPTLYPGYPERNREALVAAYARDVSALESVPPALGAFLAATDPAQAIVLAVSLGGDTDTMGAMTGALAGAHWGLDALPGTWLADLENDAHGRDHALALCRAIFRPQSIDEPVTG